MSDSGVVRSSEIDLVELAAVNFNLRKAFSVLKGCLLVVLLAIAVVMLSSFAYRSGVITTKVMLVGMLRFDQWVEARFNLSIEDRSQLRETWPFNMMANPYKQALEEVNGDARRVAHIVRGAVGMPGPQGAPPGLRTQDECENGSCATK